MPQHSDRHEGKAGVVQQMPGKKDGLIADSETRGDGAHRHAEQTKIAGARDSSRRDEYCELRRSAVDVEVP